jgi:diacylglycerol diphosphate phosphatase/phosphatidate phosphatase
LNLETNDLVRYAPVLGAVLIGGALTIDEYHNWYDVVAGAIIGTIMAFSSYRMVYAAIFDFRFNHIPLNRNIPFTYGAGPVELSNAVFTRKVGWGVDEGAFGGAPGDAIHGASSGTGANNMTGDAYGNSGYNQHAGGHEVPRTGHTIDRRPVAGSDNIV